MVKISLYFSISSLLLKYIGYIIYAYGSGSQHGFFDLMYLFLHSTSDSIIMVMLMLLSFGWTVTFNSTRDFDLYVPLCCMLGVVNILMTMLTKINDGDHDKYHMYDSIPAYIMVGFRMIAFIVFIVGVIRSLCCLKKEEKQFMKYFWQLALLGGVYLTFIPLGLILITYLETTHRK
jgi:hypothetical protein